MRYLIISDVHSNLTAFEAVLNDAAGLYEKVWCLGDMVGYGPNPNECVELLLSLDHLCLAGNHDWAVLGKLDIDDFNPDARFATLWTREQLTSNVKEYLDALPTKLLEEEFYTLVHGSPRHHVWEYILYPTIAQPNFEHFDTPYCFVGHTHSPVIFRQADNPEDMCDALVPVFNAGPIQFDESRLIVNPGSVGQPRDGDARAAYGVLDTESCTFEYRRVAYKVGEIQEKMKGYNFPPRLWNRLAFGW
ncbi:metallophosphoesterase family protein [Anaerolineales bacterium HSG24]|nr:metallophosphoesterase family protein [Anaerolineales bacterium HSG24]